MDEQQEDVKELKKEVKPKPGMARQALNLSGSAAMHAARCVKETFPATKKIFQMQQADIENSIKIAPKIYSQALATVYAFIQLPETYFEKFAGTPGAFIFSFFYAPIVAPIRSILTLLDFRTFKNFFLTVWYLITDCIPNAIGNTIIKMFNALADFFGVVRKGNAASKKIQSLQSRGMLLESKAALMEGKVWDWVKGTLYKIADKFKAAAWWLLKNGLKVIERPFLAIVAPFCECMTKINKMGALESGITSLKSTATQAFLGKLGLGAIVAAGVGGFSVAIGTAVAGFLTFMGLIAGAFTWATYLNYAGQALEFKNMVVDLFDV